ncbi:MAG: DUF2306 domain-containing protein [Bacteroidota bacterium]
MNLDNLISGNIGLIHLVFSIVALVTGSLVLATRKATVLHKKIGYAYAAAMLGVNLTAFMIYRLFGSFGIFHWMAILSLLTLISGMLPMIFKKPKSYISLHYNFMFWSVIGLYGAFTAETLVRFPDVVIESGVPNAVFYNMTGIAVAITMGAGAFFAIRNQKIWGRFAQAAQDNAVE